MVKIKLRTLQDYQPGDVAGIYKVLTGGHPSSTTGEGVYYTIQCKNCGHIREMKRYQIASAQKQNQRWCRQCLPGPQAQQKMKAALAQEAALNFENEHQIKQQALLEFEALKILLMSSWWGSKPHTFGVVMWHEDMTKAGSYIRNHTNRIETNAA